MKLIILFVCFSTALSGVIPKVPFWVQSRKTAEPTSESGIEERSTAKTTTAKLFPFHKWPNSPQLVCTKSLTCSEAHRLDWALKRRMAEELQEIILSKTNTSPLYVPYSMCRDTHFTGFMLDEGSYAWPMACLWTGSDGNASCAPAPPSERVFDYISAIEWQAKLKKFRHDIGCPPMDVLFVDHVAELYICRKRCTESGIGYLSSVIMAASIFIIVALIIGEE